MNEKEIQDCNELYEIEELFGKLGEKIFEEYKPELALLYTKLWGKLDEINITHEALRHAITADYVRTMASRFEYDSVILSERVRDMFDENPGSKTKTEELK